MGEEMEPSRGREGREDAHQALCRAFHNLFDAVQDLHMAAIPTGRDEAIYTSMHQAWEEFQQARSAPESPRGSIPESPSEAGTLPDSTPTPNEENPNG